jgi:hypothetical protein
VGARTSAPIYHRRSRGTACRARSSRHHRRPLLRRAHRNVRARAGITGTHSSRAAQRASGVHAIQCLCGVVGGPRHGERSA